MGSQLIKLEKKYFARGQYNVVLLISAMNVFKQNKKTGAGVNTRGCGVEPHPREY